jgi:C4-dicarboxylate-specific signal transduction histidine kinase
MRTRRKLALKIEQDHDSIKISVTDSGNGIQKKQFKRVFEPGFTTKKRGWD